MLVRSVFIILFLIISQNVYSENNIPIEKNENNNIKNIDTEKKMFFDKSRIREIKNWKINIKNYSKRHYNIDTYELKPTVIVLHYTVSSTFPWNLVNSESYANEKPGVASHYVVDENKIWEILPTNIISRGAYGINHKAINIEMVALNEDDLFKRKKTLDNTVKLVEFLLKKHEITINKVYSHEDVSSMDIKKIPEILDLIDKKAYSKIDPGKKNMNYILAKLRKMKESERVGNTN